MKPLMVESTEMLSGPAQRWERESGPSLRQISPLAYPREWQVDHTPREHIVPLPVRYLRPVAQLRQRFTQLASFWEAETAALSALDDMVTHPAYLGIIGLGLQAVPLILERLAAEPDFWFEALHAITGEDPASAEETVEGAAKAWLVWGQSRGFWIDLS